VVARLRHVKIWLHLRKITVQVFFKNILFKKCIVKRKEINKYFKKIISIDKIFDTAET